MAWSRCGAGCASGVCAVKDLEQDVRELKRTNEIRKRAASFFGAGARPPTQEVVAFIDANRDEFGVEPICAVLRSAGVSVAGHMRTTMVSFVK
jgi:hypothetical protein